MIYLGKKGFTYKEEPGAMKIEIVNDFIKVNDRVIPYERPLPKDDFDKEGFTKDIGISDYQEAFKWGSVAYTVAISIFCLPVNGSIYDTDSLIRYDIFFQSTFLAVECIFDEKPNIYKWLIKLAVSFTTHLLAKRFRDNHSKLEKHLSKYYQEDLNDIKFLLTKRTNSLLKDYIANV
ncbi:MAG: hypothetical protein KatS3mg101_0881 [Patescibacteria group bacterium]|nr:MAG: hypothetical protein KatS3mg101_0881 [Patescibacteria group bacterium]